MNVTLEKVDKEAPDIMTFWFRPEHPIEYIAGQYIELYLPHDKPDKRGVKRWFTLSSSPTDSPLISITTKFSDRSSTFKAALRQLAIGAPLKLIEPQGDFILPMDKTLPLVFVAGGIGITPFHSIVKFLQVTQEERSIALIYAVQTESELIFQKLWQTYPLNNFTPVVAEPSASWQGETGRLSASRIMSLSPHDGRQLLFISGPEPMVETYNKELIAKGVAEQNIVGDYFPNYTRI